MMFGLSSLAGLGGSIMGGGGFGSMKQGLMGSAMNDPLNNSSSGAVMQGGGMDVMGTTKKYSQFGGGFNMGMGGFGY